MTFNIKDLTIPDWLIALLAVAGLALLILSGTGLLYIVRS
jgi:hypothetical protein